MTKITATCPKEGRVTQDHRQRGKGGAQLENLAVISYTESEVLFCTDREARAEGDDGSPPKPGGPEMIRGKASVLIQQPIEEVFRFVATDFQGDHRSETPFQVTQDEPYHTFSWKALLSDEANRASFWQASAQVSYTFDPVPEGTRVTCEYQVSLGRGVMCKLGERFLVGPLRAEVRQWVANLKELLETPASADPQPRRNGREESAPVVQREERQEVQMKQGGQAASRKPFPKKPVILVISSLLALLFSLAIPHDYLVYQNYVQSACVITAASVTHTSNKGPSYQRTYAFTVSPRSGQTYTGYDSLGVYDTYNEAQAALSQYEVGATYPCWYNPANPTRAALSHVSFPLGLALLSMVLAFVVYSLVIGAFFSTMVSSIVPALYLLLRGQRTTGTVVGTVGPGRSREVRVSYPVADRTDELTFSSLKIGQTLTVLVDPRGVFTSLPRSAVYWTLFFATPLILVLLGVALTLAYLTWFMLV